MLTIQNLNAGYGKLQILHEISLQVPKNQFLAVLGPNGSGKSTLLKSVFGLTRIYSGHIVFQQQQLVGLPTERIGALGIAYVPQRNNLFTALTVYENLLLASRRMQSVERERALNEVNELFPILQKRRHQRSGQLSGGERQMLAIAMGWLTRPALMLLDEPSAGLSPLIANEVFLTLKSLQQRNVTIVVVEQNARSVLRVCDHVRILREGQMVFEGTAEECLADEEIIKSYLGVHFRTSMK